jgi:aspartyl-tRNA(Asn)/glutamyl-tRNA(Gln) amidotransferase subunit A
MKSDPTLLTIAEASALFESRKLSPVELTKACVAKTEALDPTLLSYIKFMPEAALEAAKSAEAAIMSGKRTSPLQGIPIGLKDIYDTAGVTTTGHSRLMRERVPAEDATTVAKLKQAGCVITGKLGTWEFAIGGPSFDLFHPPARNPWNTECQTGGSSSGSGAAIAAGLVLGAMGSDTGGSIRSPSALCGIAGIKPTYGLVSRKGVLPLSQSLDHAGPMAWTSRDCAMMLQVLAGHDPGDPASANEAVADYTAMLGKPVKGLKVGVVRHFYEKDHVATDSVKAAVETSLSVFRDMGCVVSEVTLPPLIEFAAVNMVLMSCEAYSIHQKHLIETPELYGEICRDRIMLGAFLSGADYVNAQKRRRELCAEVAAAMAGVDVLVTAASPFPAQKLAEVPKWLMYDKPSITSPFNVTGLPALATCAGFDAGGMPLSVQIVGKPFADALVLAVADAFEIATNSRSLRPPIATGWESQAAA